MMNCLLIISSFSIMPIFLVNCLFNSINVFIILILLQLISNLVIAISKKNYVLSIFLFTFTFFQLSRIFLYFFGFSELNWNRGYIGDVFDDDICIFILKLDYIVLLGINISFWIKNEKKIKIFKIKELNLNIFNSKIAFILYVVTIGASILRNLLAFQFVQSNGYVAYYKDFTPPYLIAVIAGFSKVYFYLYVCVSKKISKMILFLYFINMITSIITGVRAEFVLSLILLLVIYWNKKGNFTFYSLVKLILPGLVLFILLFFVSIFRAGNTVGDVKLKSIFVKFFDSQGVSVVVPGYYKKFENEIPEKGLAYFFPRQIAVFQNIFQTKFDDRVDEALNGFYIAKYVSYRVLGNRYASGEGMGGAFHADLYVIFGYWGVIIFSILLGFFSHKLSNIIGGNLRFLLSCSILYWFFYMPRSQPLEIFVEIFSLKFWAAIIVYFVFLNLLLRQKSKMFFK